MSNKLEILREYQKASSKLDQLKPKKQTRSSLPQ